MWTIYLYFEYYHRAVCVFSSHDDALFVFDLLQAAWPQFKENLFLCKESEDSLSKLFSVIHDK